MSVYSEYYSDGVLWLLVYSELCSDCVLCVSVYSEYYMTMCFALRCTAKITVTICCDSQCTANGTVLVCSDCRCTAIGTVNYFVTVFLQRLLLWRFAVTFPVNYQRQETWHSGSLPSYFPTVWCENVMKFINSISSDNSSKILQYNTSFSNLTLQRTAVYKVYVPAL